MYIYMSNFFIYTSANLQLYEKLYNHKNNVIVQLYEYLYLGILRIIRVVILFILE